MPGEFENPERRYRGFRPRQAAFSYYVPASVTNSSFHGLFNNSNGSQWLVVRNVITASVTAPLAYYAQALGGSHLGVENPIVPGAAKLPGLHFFGNITALAQGAMQLPNAANSGGFPNGFPIVLVPPGWYFIVYDPTVTEVMACSYFWEAIFAEELDYIW